MCPTCGCLFPTVAEGFAVAVGNVGDFLIDQAVRGNIRRVGLRDRQHLHSACRRDIFCPVAPFAPFGCCVMALLGWKE